MIGKNNYLNIRTSSAFTWNGQTGATRGFADFESIEMCRRAGAYLLMRSYRRLGLDTIERVISRWAPKNENYIKFVFKMTGLSRTMHLVFDNDYASILAAMEIIENGCEYGKRDTYFENARVSYLYIITHYKIKVYEGKN